MSVIMSQRQLLSAGCLPTDRTLLIEASRDQLGDWQVILLSPLGHRLHLSLRLALEAKLRERLGYQPQCLHHNDGILIRLTDTDEPILDLFAGLTPENVEGLILDELADSALFALRFRQNAARSLLLPRVQPGQAGAAVAATAARPRSAPGRPPACRFPHRRRDVPRMSARSSRRAAASAVARRHSGGTHRSRDAPGRDALAVRGGTAVLVHGGVHVPVRRRRGRRRAFARPRSAIARTARFAAESGTFARSARGPPGRAPAARPGPAAALGDGDGRMAAASRRSDAGRAGRTDGRLPGAAAKRGPRMPAGIAERRARRQPAGSATGGLRRPLPLGRRRGCGAISTSVRPGRQHRRRRKNDRQRGQRFCIVS